VDLDEWKRRRAAVALRVNAYPEQYRVPLADKPIGAKAWDHRGVFEIVGHRVHPTATSFAGYPLTETTLRDESGNEHAVVDAQMPLVPNWDKAGALVWDHGHWILYRTDAPQNPQQSQLVWARDITTGNLTTIYPAESVQPWHGTVDEFFRKYPARIKAASEAAHA
jgi:hypothetical protein